MFAAAVARFAAQSWTMFKTSASLRLQLADVIACAERFFSLSQRDKARYQLNDGEAFRPFGIEYSVDPTVPDLVESFSYSWSNRRSLDELPAGSGRELYSTLSDAAESLSMFAEDFAGVLIEHLRIVPPAAGFGFKAWSRLQVNHSVLAQSARSTTHELHDDGNFFTVACANQAGLELDTLGGGLTPVGPTPESLLIFAGEIMQLVTSGRIAAVRHHVRTHSAPGRVAALYFADAEPNELTRWPSSVSAETLRALIVDNWVRTGVPPVRTNT